MFSSTGYGKQRAGEADAMMYNLNVEEIAAIYLYTLETPLYRSVDLSYVSTGVFR